MRNRKSIEKDMENGIDSGLNMNFQPEIVELLLDIRDLLKLKRTSKKE